MSKQPDQFIFFDARYFSDETCDRAAVLECCSSLKEAKENADDWPVDSAVSCSKFTGMENGKPQYEEYEVISIKQLKEEK